MVYFIRCRLSTSEEFPLPIFATKNRFILFRWISCQLSFDISSSYSNICTAFCVSALNGSGLMEVSNMKEITVCHLVEGLGGLSAWIDYSFIYSTSCSMIVQFPHFSVNIEKESKAHTTWLGCSVAMAVAHRACVHSAVMAWRSPQ